MAFILLKKTYLTVEPFEYETAARYLVNGEGFKNIFLNTTYYAAVHPFYPVLCSVVYFLKGDHLTILFVQNVASTLLGLLVYQFGKRLFSPEVGWVGCFLTLFHPALWVYTTLKLHSLIFDATWFLVLLLSFMKLYELLSVTRSFFTGLVGGLACLSRSTLSLFVFLGTMWILWGWRKKASLTHLGCCVVVTFLTFFLTLTPWLVRNERRVGHRIGIVSTFGLNLWLGNNPNASGSAYTTEGKGVLDLMPTDQRTHLLTLTEWEQNELFKKEAIRFMKTHPRETVALFFRKWFAFWWRAPQTGTLYPESWKTLYAFYYLILLGLAIGGMAHAVFFSDQASQSFSWLVLFLFFSVSFTQSLFFVEGRHRWAVEPILLIFSAEGAHLLWVRVRELCAGSAVKSA